MFNEQGPAWSPNPDHGFGAIAEKWGIAPLNAGVVALVDGMCFGGELATGFLLVFLSLVVGAALVAPCSVVQRYVYKEPWPLACAKGALLGLITAIPSGLPAGLTLAWGAMGAIGLRYRAMHPHRSPDNGRADNRDDQQSN